MEDGAQKIESPVWFVFGDLMAGLLGLFVLLFALVVTFELDLMGRLASERAAVAQAKAQMADSEARYEASERARTRQEERLLALEQALATPLAAGAVTLEDGRIGIAGSVLFQLYSAELQPEGAKLLSQIAGPLARFVEAQNELVMVGGFTDDLPIRGENPLFTDNWQLSTERALTVTRALVARGVPADRIFAAGFGAHHPAVPNLDEASRARNRRVEIVPQSVQNRSDSL